MYYTHWSAGIFYAYFSLVTLQPSWAPLLIIAADLDTTVSVRERNTGRKAIIIRPHMHTYVHKDVLVSQPLPLP